MNPDQLIKGAVKVFSAPDIYLRISAAMNNPRSSVMDIGHIISEDQGLTARLLKIANSPLFGFPSKIETISQAVLLIGTHQIRDLALATSVMKLFEGIPEDLISMGAFWRHSVACGVTARVIAGYRREPNIEKFFTAGILHDIGRLIMFSKMAEKCGELMLRCREQGQLLYKTELEMLRFDHTDMGAALLKKWELPSNLVEPVAFHHTPRKALRHPVETAVIHLADIIANALRMGNSGNPFVPPLQEEAWKELQLQPGILPFIVEQSLLQFDAAIGLVLPGEKG